jgi:hypothetical protein
MKPKSAKRIVIILGGLVLVACLALYGLYTLIRLNIEKTVAFDNQYAERVAAEEEARALRASVEKIGPEMQRLNTRIVQRIEVVEFIEMIEKRARELGLGIEVESAQENKHESDQYQYLRLTLRTQGSWKETYLFLSLLESLPYKISLNNIGLNAQSLLNTPEQVWIGTYTLDVVRYK